MTEQKWGLGLRGNRHQTCPGPGFLGHAGAQGSDDVWDSGDHFVMVGERMTASSLTPGSFLVTWVNACSRACLPVWRLSSSSLNNCVLEIFVTFSNFKGIFLTFGSSSNLGVSRLVLWVYWPLSLGFQRTNGTTLTYSSSVSHRLSIQEGGERVLSLWVGQTLGKTS